MTQTNDLSRRVVVALRVNDRDEQVEVEARETLADTLRERLGLTGTHVGCEQGVCGACTVLVDGTPARSCLVYTVQAEGREVRTVEGVQGEPVVRALQEAFTRHHALQCGFCTPGFLMMARWELGGGCPRRQGTEAIAAGNLCRCGCYQGIRAALREVETGGREADEQ